MRRRLPTGASNRIQLAQGEGQPVRRRPDEDLVTAAFRAMSTNVAVMVPKATPTDEQSLADGIERQFGSFEATFSRFRAESELSRLNTARGPIVVSEQLFHAIERARGYWQLSE